MGLECAEYCRENWNKVTAKDMALKFKKTIKANTHLFRCPNCKQYLVFIHSNNQRPHFRHKNGSLSCEYKIEETNLNNSYVISSSIKRITEFKEYPIFLYIENLYIFSFNIGLPALSDELISFLPDHIQFNHNRNRYYGKTVILSQGEDVIPNRITKLPFAPDKKGEFPLEYYSVIYDSPSIEYFWPKLVKGINDNGAIFIISSDDQKNDYKKMVYDSSPSKGSEYLFMIKDELVTSGKYSELSSLSKISQCNGYSIYKGKLTDNLSSLIVALGYSAPEEKEQYIPLLPVHNEEIEENKNKKNIIFNSDEFYLFKDSIEKSIDKYNCKKDSINSKKLTFECNSEFQNSFFINNSDRYILLRDSKDRIIEEGVCNNLPKDKLKLEIKYNAFVEIIRNSFTLEKISFSTKSTEEFIFDSSFIQYGDELKVYYGIDCVFSVKFIKIIKQLNHKLDFIEKLLSNSLEDKIPINHTSGYILKYFDCKSRIYTLLLKTFKEGNISKKAWSEINELIIQRNSHGSRRKKI